MPEDERPADFHLVGERCAVLRWPALHHIADVNILAADGDSLFRRGAVDHLREKLPGAPDERQPLFILVCAGAFPDHDELGPGIAGAEDDGRPRFAELAPAASLERLFLGAQRLVGRQ